MKVNNIMHRCSAGFYLFLLIFIYILITLFLGINILKKPLSINTKASTLSVDNIDIFDIYQKESGALRKIDCNSSTNICNLVNDSPIIIKIKPDMILPDERN